MGVVTWRHAPKIEKNKKPTEIFKKSAGPSIPKLIRRRRRNTTEKMGESRTKNLSQEMSSVPMRPISVMATVFTNPKSCSQLTGQNPVVR